jgi:endonuclease YncB( thermonuclease family)
VTGGAGPGWYPDYEAPPGHQRYWDGERWTERRSVAPVDEPTSSASSLPIPGWVWAAVAVLVAVSAIALVVGDDESTQSGSNASAPTSTEEPPSEQSQPEPDLPRKTWEVTAVVDGTTLRLSNGAEVRIVGIEDDCAADQLAELVVDQEVTLTRRGPDKDNEGRLLRYVERNGTDIGKRLIQRGWATASDEPHPRRAIYRRVDGRSPATCS